MALPSAAPRAAPRRPRRPAARPRSAGAAAPADAAAARVLRQFRLVFNAVKAHFRQVEKTVGLGGAQVWALSVIRAAPGLGVGGLAAAMDIHQSTASNLVKGLAERQLVAIVRDELDRRAVRLKILPEGNRVLRRSPGPFAGVLPDALAALDARTLRRLEADLGTLIAQLGIDAQAGRTPLAQL